MMTFDDALQEARNLYESTKTDFDDFYKLFSKYEAFDELKNIKKTTNSVTFELNSKKYKIEVQFGEIEILVNNKNVKTIEILNKVNQDDVDSVVDYIKK